MIGSDETPAATVTTDVLDSLDRLVDAGLITFVETAGAARYRMLETVRDFAAGQLDENDRALLGLSHATYYSTIVARIGALRFDDHEASVRLGDQELGNLRAAMTWAYANAHHRLGMSIASHLWRYFWEQASGGNENVRWGRTALELIDEDDDDVLLVAAGTVIEAYNLGDRNAEAYAAKRVRRGLGAVNDPVVKSRLLVALGTSVMDTDPRAAEAFLDEAWATAPLQPRSIDILNNYIELSWLVGTLDGATIRERLHEVLRLLSEPPPTALKIEAGAAACAGHWDEVLRLTETPTGFDKSLTDLRLLRSEALCALGRYDDAFTLARQPYEDDYPTDIQRAHLVCASIDVARAHPGAAFERLLTLAELISRDERRLALAMHVASLLAVTVSDLGQHETAATLFGFAGAEQNRLDIALRLSVQPLVQRALEASRAALGAARFDELAAQGANTEWRDLPTVDRAPAASTR